MTLALEVDTSTGYAPPPPRTTRIIRGPIWFTYADSPITCRHHHPLLARNMRHSTRGDPIHLLVCSNCTLGSWQMGVQSTANNLVTWYALGQEEFSRIVDSDPRTPVLTWLAIAGYHPMEEL